ncbi:hypothetical protein [Hymenobacter sp. AT01-02]|uniref:hypothetical protein n=1 Tax=Hymenobacter sp. AT01-02 TaxID=1571877 RepID=UPI0006E196A3|nr:hypothetical protein [Hymenobacter sp. AT01-02]
MRHLADAFRQQQHAFLARYQVTNALPSAFQRQAALDIDLEWARLLLDYPGYHRTVAKQAAILPAEYYDFLRQLPRQQLDEQVTREPCYACSLPMAGGCYPMAHCAPTPPKPPGSMP